MNTNKSGVVEQPKKAMLLGFFSDAYDGPKLLLYLVLIIAAGAGVKHCVSDHFKEQRIQENSTTLKKPDSVKQEMERQ